MKKDPHSLRLAHLSDPHFSHITYNLNQFCSKRWLGNLNLMLFRKNSYQTDHLEHIPELLDTLDVETTVISGDFSSTSLDEEFTKGRDFVRKFSMPVLTLPGNHDAYTKESVKAGRYYTYFPSEALEKTRVETRSLGKGWWWVGLDCALATNVLFSNGRFFPEMEPELERVLGEIPSDERIVIGNHFPLFPSGTMRHNLARYRRLQEILKRDGRVKLYLHGHDHTPYIIDKREEGHPLVLNSGSAARKPDGTFYLIDLYEKECFVERLLFRKENNEFSWVVDIQKNFKFH